MNDNFQDWEKKYWAQRMQRLKNNPEKLLHHEPAHLTQDRNRMQNSQNQWKEIDPLTAMYVNHQGMHSRGMGPQTQVVNLREGAIFYRKINAEAFGTTIPMVRSCGPATGIAGKEFEMRQQCNCYVIDNMEVVDLGNINSNNMHKLIEVRAPFIGTVLVAEHDIVTLAMQAPTILKG